MCVHRIFEHSALAHLRLIVLRVEGVANCKITYFITPSSAPLYCSVGSCINFTTPWCSVSLQQLSYIDIVVDVHENECMKKTVLLISYGAIHKP